MLDTPIDKIFALFEEGDINTDYMSYKQWTRVAAMSYIVDSF